MLRLMADEDATSLQKGAMVLAAGKGGKRLHEAAEMTRRTAARDCRLAMATAPDLRASP